MEIGSLDFKIAMDSADVEKQLQAIMDKLRAFDNQTSGRLRQTATQAENTKRVHREMTDDMHKGITSITDDYHKLNNVLGKLQSIGGIAIGGYALGSTIKQVVQTRGEFQQLEIAFSTMLGSGEKAAELMDKITKTAATTPFDLQGVADGAKQLLAYGVSVDEVNEKIVQLGDIAAGMSLPLGDLVYLYGTTMVQGRMFTQDLKQFQGRGIPITEELAKVLGVTKNEVAGLVSAGKVTAKVFKQAMENMSGAGGKFYNLMEKQSKSLTGQLSNLGDAVDMMYNEIGKKGEKLFADVIEKISWLVENYKKVGEAIMEVIAIYGVYKGSLLAVNTLHKAAIAFQKSYAAAQMMSAAAGKTLTTAQLTANASMITLNKGVKALTASLKASSLAALTNPYVLLAAAITAVGYAIYKTVTYEDEFQKANRRLQDAVVETNAEIFNEQARISELAETVKTAKEGTDQYKIAKKELLEVAEKYNIKLEDENGKLDITMMKYNSLQQAVKDYYAEKGRQAFLAAEKENMIKGITAAVQEFQAEAIEEIITDNEDELSADEIGKLRAQISKAAYDLQELLMKGRLRGEVIGNGWTEDQTIKLSAYVDYGNGDSYEGGLPKSVQNVFDLYHNEINGLEKIYNELSQGMVGTSGAYRLEYNLMKAAKEAEASKAAMAHAAEAFGATGLTLPEKKETPKTETEKEPEDKDAEKKRKKAEQDLKKAEAEALQHRKAIEQIADENEDAIKDDTYQNRIDKLNKENERIIKAIGENADKYVEASVAAAKKRAEAQGKKLSDKEVETARETARNEITALQTKAVETQGSLMERQEGDLLQDSVNRYIQYYQKLMELERQYNEDKNAARTQEEKDVVEANYKNEKANLETAMQKEYGGESNDAFGEFADKIQTMGLKKVADEINTVQQAIAKLNQESGGKFSKEYATKLANLNAKLAIANLNFEKLTAKQRKNRETLSEVGKYWNKLSDELKGVASDFRAIGENWSDTIANVLDTASVVGDSVMTIITGVVQLTNISSMSIQTTSKTASTAIKAMEAASIILAIISAAMQIAMKMVDIFSNEKKVSQEEITMYHNQMDALDALIDKQHELLESTSALNAELYGENLRQTYQREIAATEQIAMKYAEEHDKGEHSLGYQLDSASSKYGVNSKGDLYNKGYAGYTNKQMEDATNSAAGVISWVKQMSAEEYADFRTTRFFAELTSKNSKFAESLDTINEKVQEIANIDDIELQVKTQTDLDEVAENLTDLATNAEATAKDIGESFQSTMHNAMKAILKDKVLTNGLEQWYNDFAAAMDGGLTQDETERLKTSYEEKVANAQQMWQEMNKVAGFDLDGGEDMTTMSGALANASQESIDLLAGQTNAVRVNQIDMLDIMRQQLLATVAIQESTNGINTIVQQGFDTLAGKLQSSDIRAMGGI